MPSRTAARTGRCTEGGKGAFSVVTFRRARPQDARLLASVSKRAFDDDVHYGAPGPGGPPGYDSEAWQRRMMRYGEYYVMAREGEVIGGMIVFRKEPR